MEDLIYNSLYSYFNALSKLGYLPISQPKKLLVLLFYYRYMYEDFRGYVQKDDYYSIERALNCLFGTTCLIPYPNYLKMGKLRIGEITEIVSRIKNNEAHLAEYDEHLEVLDNRATSLENRANKAEERITIVEGTKVIKGKSEVMMVDEIVI